MRKAYTIYEKLQVVKYAEALEAQQKRTVILRNKTKRKERSVKKRKKGLNIQSACVAHFGPTLGKLKVCRLRKVAEEQRWKELTEAQQRSMYGLTDELKQSMGLNPLLKGWKTFSEKEREEIIEREGKLPRWRIPGDILKD